MSVDWVGRHQNHLQALYSITGTERQAEPISIFCDCTLASLPTICLLNGFHCLDPEKCCTWHGEYNVQWGADFEKRYVDDFEFSLYPLSNVIAKVDGQNVFENVNPWGRRVCKLAFHRLWS